MKALFLALLTFATVNASAATVKIGASNFDKEDSSLIIDTKEILGLKAIQIVVPSRDPIRVWEALITYRGGGALRTKFKPNGVYSNGQGTGWLVLPDNGLAVRRVTIEGENHGSFEDGRIVVYGQD